MKNNQCSHRKVPGSKSNVILEWKSGWGDFWSKIYIFILLLFYYLYPVNLAFSFYFTDTFINRPQFISTNGSNYVLQAIISFCRRSAVVWQKCSRPGSVARPSMMPCRGERWPVGLSLTVVRHRPGFKSRPGRITTWTVPKGNFRYRPRCLAHANFGLHVMGR